MRIYIRRELYASLLKKKKTDIKRESEIARTTILYFYTSPFFVLPFEFIHLRLLLDLHR
jgi:hypothetical protein